MQIEGISGHGPADVNSEHRILIAGVASTIVHHVNHHSGQAYNAVFAVNPDGADDCIFYIKNNSDVDMIVDGVWWQTSAAEEVYYKVGDTGTAVATNGAEITPVAPNSILHVADCLCYSNVGDGAVDITDISGGSTFQKLWLTSAESKFFNCSQDIIIKKNATFTIYCVGGDTMLRGTVVFNFHSEQDVG